MQAVRVIKTIPEGTAVTQDMIQTVSVGGYNMPANAEKRAQDVVGKYTTAELQPGDYILSTKITDKSQSPYLTNLGTDKEAISIPVKSFAAGLSGKLQSGDIVSLIAGSYGTGKQTICPPGLKYVKLLAVTNSEGDDIKQVSRDKKDNSSDQNKNIPSTLTLLVNPEQAKNLVDYADNGSLYAVLAFRGAADKAENYLRLQDQYFTLGTAASRTSSEDGRGASNGK